MFTDFILVRHGETPYNQEHILQGWIDTPLNENGYRQAELTAEMLRNEPIDEACFSDLQRASETARIILKHHPGVPSFPSWQLREWHLGILQNYSYAELNEILPEYVKMLQTESIEMAVPSGESRKEFQKRISNVFQELAERFSGKRVLIVTHGGVLVRLYRFLGGEVPQEGKVPIPGNASVSRVRYDHERKIWSLIAWNQNYSPQSDSSAKPPAL